MSRTGQAGRLDLVASPVPAHRVAIEPDSRIAPTVAIGMALAVLAVGYLSIRLTTWLEFLSRDGSESWLVVSLVAGMVAAALFLGCRWCVLLGLSLHAFSRGRAIGEPAGGPWPFVSILVPAYNEERTIGPALESLLALDYPSFEIIVVDDGSTDATGSAAAPYQERTNEKVRLYQKANGGKWSALNHAFERARGEWVLCVDADSRLDRSALRRLASRLRTDPAIMGVAGQVRVRNRVNVLTRLQALEYLIGNGLSRMAQSGTGTVLVVPGPIGLFRRRAMEEVFSRYSQWGACEQGQVRGPFEGDTFAEDFDLSLAILMLGGRIVYEPDAVAHTQAPERAFGLLNQRYRWVRGSIQVLRKFFRRAPGSPTGSGSPLMAWIVLTYVVELTVLPLVMLVGVATGVWVLGSGVAAGSMLDLWVGIVMVHMGASLLVASMHGEGLGLLAVAPLYGPYHAILLNCAWLIAIIDEFRGSRMRW